MCVAVHHFHEQKTFMVNCQNLYYWKNILSKISINNFNCWRLVICNNDSHFSSGFYIGNLIMLIWWLSSQSSLQSNYWKSCQSCCQLFCDNASFLIMLIVVSVILAVIVVISKTFCLFKHFFIKFFRPNFFLLHEHTHISRTICLWALLVHEDIMMIIRSILIMCLMLDSTSGAEQRSRVRIRHLPQWSWCAAGSLCNTVKSQGRGGNLRLRPKKIYKKK